MLEQDKKVEVDFFDQKAQSNDRGYSMLDSRGYQRVVSEFQRYLTPNKDLMVLDVGCGTGMFLVHLKNQGFRDLAGVETSMRLRQRFRDDSIPLYSVIPDETFDAVFLLDVLEHIADDVEALTRIHSALRPGGKLILSVPAHPFLWGPHDIVNEHERRYRRHELRDKLTTTGFEIHRFSYWNMFGFPVICLQK